MKELVFENIINDYRERITPIIKALLEQGKEEQAFYVSHGMNILLNLSQNYPGGTCWQTTDYTGNYSTFPSKYKEQLGYGIFDKDYPHGNNIWNIEPKPHENK